MLVNDIFQSISGEVGEIPQGAVAWFVRFQNCNLRCAWCDTPDALEKSSPIAIEQTPEQISAIIPRRANVVLTGGEPLLQDRLDLCSLLELLAKKDCHVQIETNGSIPPFLNCPHIFDYKTPSSGMHKAMMSDSNFLEVYTDFMLWDTWIKFVIKDVIDLDFTIDKIYDFNTILPGLRGVRIAISIDSGEGVCYAIKRLQECNQGMVTSLAPLMSRIVFNFQLHKHFNLK